MTSEIGRVESLFRYPVKSMAGEPLDAAELGWHGIEGDRRFALRRVGDYTAFPWLTATKLPELIRYEPLRGDAGAKTPTHVRTPDGDEFPIFSDELARDIERRHGTAVQMTQFKNGIFDDAPISVIASATIAEVERLSGRGCDVRRFRPNVVVRLADPVPFSEDRWLGGTLTIGNVAIAVTMRDLRCGMVNLDPETAKPAPEVMKAIVRANDNHAGIYGTITRAGRISVGDAVSFHDFVV